MFWWLLKHVLLGPLLRLLFRPRPVGLEHVPRSGRAILASNHVSVLDTVLLPLVVPRRQVVFLGKEELFQRWWQGWFFRAVGVLPVRRTGGSASEAALRSGIDALEREALVGIFPEGTRSPDGRLYRGKTGAVRMALHTGAPIVPVALVGTRELMPPGRLLPRPGRTEVRFGEPVTPAGEEAGPTTVRALTDRLMGTIAELSGQERVDEYASRVKAGSRGTAPGGAGPPGAGVGHRSHGEDRTAP